MRIFTANGDASTAHSNLLLAGVTDRAINNGTFLDGWVGVRFDVQVTSTDNDPNIYHEFKFITPATLSDPNQKENSRFVLKNAGFLLKIFFYCDKLFYRPRQMKGTYF